MKYQVKLRIGDLLRDKHITQKQLAEMSHLREATISDIVRGTRTVINFEHLANIAEALQVDDIHDLISLEKTE